MPKISIKDWLWSQKVPPEVLADFEKLFAFPEKVGRDYKFLLPMNVRIVLEELSAILEGKD